MQQALARAVADKQAYRTEHRVARPDGNVRIVQEYADVSFDDEGRLQRIIGAVQDVTEVVQARVRTEAAERARAWSWPRR